MIPDATDPAEALRRADWDLPVSEEFVQAVLRGPGTRRPRSTWWIAAGVAACAALIMSVVVLTLRSGSDSGPPAATATGPPAATATGPTTVATGTPTSSPPDDGTASVGGWRFAVPAGWTLEPEESFSNVARYGRQGLVNDRVSPGPDEMSVTLRGRILDGPDGGRIFVTVLEPHPTNAHPGPRPAADKGDAAAAVTTIVDRETAGGGTASPVESLAVGRATLIHFAGDNGLLLIVPRAAPGQLLMLQAGATPPQRLVGLAGTLTR